MASFITLLNLALASPLYINSRMFIPFKGPSERVPGQEVRGAEPPEFYLQAERGRQKYRFFAEPERFYRGLILDRTL